MKKKLYQEIEIPEGVEVLMNGSEVIMKGPEGENRKKLNLIGLVFDVKNNKIRVGHEKATKSEKKMINTILAHLRNMIQGVQKKYEYKLKICSSHFPMTVKAEGREVIIKNFLGEKIERKAIIPENAEIQIKGKEIIVSSTSKETAGQAAANLESVTKIRNKDKRVFQDGIYITNKGGKEI